MSEQTECIKREEAVKLLEVELVGTAGYVRRRMIEKSISIIHAIPAADVVEVVRCRQCRSYFAKERKDGGVSLRCKNFMCETFPDHFCSLGKRKDGDAHD